MENPHHSRAVHSTSHDKAGFLDKVFIMLLVISALYIGYLFFQDQIIHLLKMNPYVWAVFSHIANEITKRTMLGLFYASFFGSLFFIFLPMEIIFIYYLNLGYSIPLIIVITLIGNLMGLCLDYLFGFVFGARMVKFVLRDNFEKFHKMIAKWGAAVIFFGNVIIFPIQPVSVVIGSAKYPFWRFFILSMLGFFVKLFFLVVASMYLQQYIPWLA